MKKLTTLLLALAMMLSLAACGGGSAPANSPSNEPPASSPAEENTTPAAPEVEEVTLNIAYMPNWGALWAVATADAKGYFAEEGITLKLTAFEDGPSEIAAMESGAMDIAYIGPGAHKLCSTGNTAVIQLQHLGEGD